MNNPNQQIKLDLSDAETITCDECKGKYFATSFIIKRLAAIMSPTGQEAMIPLQIFRCNDCGHVNKEFLK